MFDESAIYRRKRELEALISAQGEAILAGGFTTMEDYKLACGTRNGLTLALSVLMGEYDGTAGNNKESKFNA